MVERKVELIPVDNLKQYMRRSRTHSDRQIGQIAASIREFGFTSVVYDPFLGSGSTLIACEASGRVCRGMEIDPRYCDVIIARWEQFTGGQAERVA